MASRGLYKRISDLDRKKILDAYQNGGRDYQKVADELDIKRTTARAIIATFLRSGRMESLPRGGHTYVKMDEEMLKHLQAILNANPALALEQMKVSLQQRFPDKPEVSTSTIGRALDGMLLAGTQNEEVIPGPGDPDVAEQRGQYAEWLLQEGVLGHCVFIGETTYWCWTTRTRKISPGEEGWPRVQSADREVNGRRDLICCTVNFAVSDEHGLVHHRIAVESASLKTFEEFLADTIQACRTLFRTDDVVYLLYSNSHPHAMTVDLPRDTDSSVRVKILPPFSSFLSSAAAARSALNAEMQRSWASPEWQKVARDKEAAQRAGVHVARWRCELLREIATQIIYSITQPKCRRWFNETLTYMPRCLARQDIDDKSVLVGFKNFPEDTVSGEMACIMPM